MNKAETRRDATVKMLFNLFLMSPYTQLVSARDKLEVVVTQGGYIDRTGRFIDLVGGQLDARIIALGKVETAVGALQDLKDWDASVEDESYDMEMRDAFAGIVQGSCENCGNCDEDECACDRVTDELLSAVKRLSAERADTR